MGRFLAALLIALAILWLRPMCAGRPAGTAERVIVAPAAPAAPATPAALKPAKERPPIVVKPYPARRPFASNEASYGVVAAIESRVDATGEDLLLTLFSRSKGVSTGRADTAYPMTFAPKAVLFASMPVDIVAMDEILAGPTQAGTELEWSISYRLKGEDAASRRCFRIRAVPRRERGGIAWTTLEETSVCDPENMPVQTGPEGDFRNLAR